MSKLNMCKEKVPTISDWEKIINEEEIKKIIERRNNAAPFHSVEKDKKAWRFNFEWITTSFGDYPSLYSESLERFTTLDGETYYDYVFNSKKDLIKWLTSEMHH